MKKKLTVLLTGVGGGGHGEQILKALRLSEHIDFKIIGTDMSPLSKGLADVDIAHILPPASSANYMDELLSLCKKYDVKVLFHGSEPELKVMNINRDRIEGMGIMLPINSASVIDICMDKFKTIEFLKDNGFAYPKSFRIKNLNDAMSINIFPLVFKPSIGGGGSANVLIVQNKEELEIYSRFMLNEYKEFIVQEYVGTPEDEYTVGVLCSMDGELINSVAVKRNIMTSLSNRLKVKNRTDRKELGSVLAISSGVSQGKIGRFKEVTEQCERIAMKLGARGAINIQCRYVDNIVYVFEINPRFSGTTSLRAMVGYNEPEVLIRKHLFSEQIQSHFDYKEGYILRGLSETFIADTKFINDQN